jgi:hypothetical protein
MRCAWHAFWFCMLFHSSGFKLVEEMQIVVGNCFYGNAILNSSCVFHKLSWLSSGIFMWQGSWIWTKERGWFLLNHFGLEVSAVSCLTWWASSGFCCLDCRLLGKGRLHVLVEQVCTLRLGAMAHGYQITLYKVFGLHFHWGVSWCTVTIIELLLRTRWIFFSCCLLAWIIVCFQSCWMHMSRLWQFWWLDW